MKDKTINQSGPDIPNHLLQRCIGGGAYGEVWLATTATGAPCAVKIVRRQSFEQARPFEREFEGIQNFEPISHTHPGLVNILHVGKNDAAGYFYYVMEAADDVRHGRRIDPAHYKAKTLATVMRQGNRPLFDECLRIGIALTSALGHLHHLGLIHRDVKPSNIIFVRGVPKLADVGLVTTVRDGATVVGSPGFMPPEGPGRPSGDIYSLGILLYELFTGKKSLEFPELPSTLQQVEATPQLFQVYKIILKACEVDVRKRCQNADELHLALAGLLPEVKAPARNAPPRHDPEPDRSPRLASEASTTKSATSSKRIAIAHKADTQIDSRLAEILRDRLTRHGHRVALGREVTTGPLWVREVETRVREAEAVVVLLSEDSQRCERLAYEVSVARQVAEQRGGPLLLPVRMASSGPLAEPLASLLNPLPHLRWDGPPDDEPLVTQLLHALENPLPGRAAPSLPS